ncbi:MAG: O-antigen ligase family protein [Acidobacteria bacterium]|nr:O-antigen ligase family protein [Acidobacteriota bacterium]
MVALAIAVLPLALWEATRLTVALILLGLSLPAFMSVAGQSASINIAASDLLLVLILGALVSRMAVTRSAAELQALRPVAFAVTQYGAFLFLLLFVHFGTNEVMQTAQRLELFLFPLIIGAFAALTNRHVRLLKAYVLAATLLAAVWPIEHFGLQKNPAGGMVGNAILLLIAFAPLRSFFPCLLILVPGLLLTESRGAVAATTLGLVIIALARGGRRGTLLKRVIPVALIASIAFLLLPAETTSRLTTYSSGKRTAGEYALYIREQYREDAHEVIDAHPWTGVGVGNYLTGDASNLTQAKDPHQVLLLQAAEGGWAFAASFVLLIGASCLALYRMRHLEIAPAVAAVFVATAAHGLVDIYWVRGTPVLAWLLLGMACGMHMQNARPTQTK